MGLIANLLNRKSVPSDRVDSSLQMLDKLKERRGAELGKYFDLMIDPRKAPAESAPSTIEDLDERGHADSATYSPPLAAVVHPSSNTAGEDGDPLEKGINTFFDEFARQASAHNLSADSKEHQVGIQRPSRSGETFPEAGGKPVLNAHLHTDHWAIFFFGHDANIDVYLLPFDAQSAVTFKEVHTDACQPLLAVTYLLGSAGLEWYVDGKRFSREHMPALAKDLLDDLIQAATESKQ